MAAAAAFRANKFEEAESLYTEALEAAQQGFDRAAALSSRAQCRLKLKNFEGAREDAQAARALDPENPKAWYRLGVALSALGRLSEAQEALGEALQRRPEDADVQLALRAVLKRQSEGSEGRYDWLQVYQKYFETGPLAVAKSKGKVKEKSRCESECEVMAEDRLIATLDVEPYVGPVRVGYSPERGRGLFVTEDVAKGRLLLCARALVTGLNEDLPSQLVAAAETSAHLMEAVRSLSRGHPESEQKMPALSMAQLAKPEDLIDGDEPLDQLPLEEARNILYHNQFSLPLVNPNAAPLEVGNDTERSGLWLLPVFVNHSCLPNVQRIIVLDCLFLRAGRDLKEGEELFDGYVETLQPLWHRRESLEAYGFRCSCERCVLEEAIYPEGGARREELRKILEQAAGAVASRTEGAQLAEQMEAVATAADILMDRALAAALQEGVVPSTSIYQVPSVALSAQRMAMIRGGFERASDEEVFDFQRQDALQALLLGSVANVLRGYALSLRGLNRYVEAAGAWQRALDALDQVIPGSELGAIVANDMLSNKLLAFHLDHKQAAKKEMRSALLRSHWAYSGGAETWRHFSDKLFAPSVLDGGIAAWKTLQAEDPKLDTGGYQALPETVPAVPAKEKPGFEDLLRKRAAQRGKKSHEMRTPETTSDVAKPAQRTENQKSQGKEAFPPSDGTGPSAGGGASCEVTTAVEDGVEQVTCVVNLPGLSSATEANLEVSESELRVTSLRADMPHVVCATLPLCVDPNSSRARWSKRHQQLTVKSACLFAKENQPYPEVPAGSVRPVGGFRTEDLVAHEQSRWVGRVAEALYNVEVQVTKRGASGSGGRALGICLFQVCSEGHSMLDAVEKGCNQTSWQEMCPHFTGQKVEAGAKVWRQAEWLTEMPKFLNKRFDGYKSLEGTVTSVELQMLGVRWLDSWGKDIIGHHMPPEWVPPSCLTRLELSDSPSEGWSLGEHAQAVLPGSWPWQAVKVLDPRSPSAILTKTTTLVTVCWADGTTEEDLPSTQLLPRQEFYSHDFLPHDLVARSTDADEAWTAEPLQYTAAMAVPPVTAGEDYFPHLGTENLYDDPYEPPEGYDRDQFRDFSNFLGQVLPHQPPYPPQTPSTGEILPSNGPRQGLSQLPPRVPVGVVQTVDLKARTAVVEWRCSHRESPQEVSLFELAPHPYFELRLGDIVFIPPYLVPEVGHWIGRVVQLQNFTVLVYLGNGAVRPFDLDVLRVASCDIEGQSEVEHGPSIGPEDHLGSDPEVEMEFDQLAEKEASPVVFPLPHDAAQELGLTSDAGRRFQEQLQDLQEQLEAARLQGSVQQTSTVGCDPGVPGVPQEDAPKMYFYVVQHLPQMETGGSSSSTSRPETLALDTFDEDHEPLDHKFVDSPSPAPKVLMRAVRREMTVLRKGLLDGDEGVVAPILVRSYASRSDLFRAMVVGPPGTPYADLPFFFDLALSPQYPAEPPRVHYLSQFASSSERLNPNLYCDGKVCLSLLGTWPGPGWDPNKSTLLQVLVSLQGLVLVEDPYFNEPGHESDAKSEHGRNASALYNENVRLLCLRAALKIDQQPPRGFEEVVARHFSVHGPKLLAQCEEDLQGQGSEGFRQVLSRSILPKLRERWAMK